MSDTAQRLDIAIDDMVEIDNQAFIDWQVANWESRTPASEHIHVYWFVHAPGEDDTTTGEKRWHLKGLPHTSDESDFAKNVPERFILRVYRRVPQPAASLFAS